MDLRILHASLMLLYYLDNKIDLVNKPIDYIIRPSMPDDYRAYAKFAYYVSKLYRHFNK